MHCTGAFFSSSISIHTPREGSDDTGGLRPQKGIIISIHTPREESDTTGEVVEAVHLEISIHAPREESDIEARDKAIEMINPRSP